MSALHGPFKYNNEALLCKTARLNVGGVSSWKQVLNNRLALASEPIVQL